MCSGAATLGAIESAALRLARELPEAHRFTRSFRQSWFDGAAHKLRDLLFLVDPLTLSDETLEQIPRLIELGIKTIETHMLASEDMTLRPILDDLRTASDLRGEDVVERRVSRERIVTTAPSAR
jgi:hypothetical protein